MAGKTSRALKDFLGEAEEIIEKLNLDLMMLGEGAEEGESNPEVLNSIFRGAHSLKGISGMFGFDDISELAHHMENLLDRLRMGKIPFNSALVETLFDSLEILTRLVHGKGEQEEFSLDVTPIVTRIEGLLAGETASDGSILSQVKISPEVLNVLTEYEEHRLLENLKKGRRILWVKATFHLASFDQELVELTDALKQQGEVISTLPCVGEIADRIGFQILFGTSVAVDQVVSLVGGEHVGIEPLNEEPAEASTFEEPSKPTPPVLDTLPGEESTGASIRSASRTVRVDIDKLDSLMNIVGELVLSKGAVAAICDRLKTGGDHAHASELQKATRMLERRLDELQKGVMDVRMVPVGQLFERMIRIVRKVAKELEKKVTLDTRGVDTELDKLIVEDLSDPLMHTIRNAIDHGIESPAERAAAGKPETGTICLWASQKGNHVVIEVRDDGRGIDPGSVRRQAIKRGLVDENTELSHEDVLDLLFTPGFSTRDEVTDLSGRGVGMDVVKNNISALSGMIEIDSRVGEGTTIVITLPITLAIIKALVVRVGSKTYAIPINSVMETLMIETATIRTIERREVIELRQTTLPLLRLDEVFKLPERSAKDGRSYVAVVGLAEKKMGIVVDELLGQQDVVIKSLGHALSFVRGVAGAADLGNQKTILVLDVGGLMSEALRGESNLYV